ncbi:MAG: alpha/beta fold hydrolase [Deltaproteobacteria bacterium]|jgi:pimeloyl-ACP methyl ester carboxylesterase|nr:MAG: alpha/beta fold hydrolase [Deltaproteobacteria bacterium]
MSIDTQLCAFKTADNERLHGLLFTPPQSPSDLALIMVHGVAMNFYLPPLVIFGQELAQRGYHCFVINTRGHDWVSRAGNLTAFGGAAFETFEDALIDLDGALAHLAAQGYRRFILVGHSLGCVKSLLYHGSRQRADIIGIVSCSCPKQFYSARALEQPQFTELMGQAEQWVSQGEGNKFLWAPASGGEGLFTAKTYVNKYGRHENNDVRPHARRLGCPLLTIAGGAEHPYFPEYAKELADAAGANAICKIVPDANHFYSRQERTVIDLISQWLQQFKN